MDIEVLAAFLKMKKPKELEGRKVSISQEYALGMKMAKIRHDTGCLGDFSL